MDKADKIYLSLVKEAKIKKFWDATKRLVPTIRGYRHDKFVLKRAKKPVPGKYKPDEFSIGLAKENLPKRKKDIAMGSVIPLAGLGTVGTTVAVAKSR